MSLSKTHKILDITMNARNLLEWSKIKALSNLSSVFYFILNVFCFAPKHVSYLFSCFKGLIWF